MAGTDMVERLLDLWSQPLSDRPYADFAQLYADPVTVNGAELRITDLVGRARTLQGAFDDLSRRVLDVVETPDRLVVAFELSGRHTGTWPSALGDVPASGRRMTVRTIDVLTIADGRITAIWVVSDDLSLLTQLGAIPVADRS
jgi:predicted ester cyclase